MAVPDLGIWRAIQAERIVRANTVGPRIGRPRSVDRERVLKLRRAGKGPSMIARELRIGRASVYRVLCEFNQVAGKHDVG